MSVHRTIGPLVFSALPFGKAISFELFGDYRNGFWVFWDLKVATIC